MLARNILISRIFSFDLHLCGKYDILEQVTTAGQRFVEKHLTSTLVVSRAVGSLLEKSRINHVQYVYSFLSMLITIVEFFKLQLYPKENPR